MIVPLLLSIGFFGTLVAFGFVTSVYGLKVKNSLAALGFSSVLGIGYYLIGLNLIAYVLPIQTAYWVTLLGMLCWTAGLWLKNTTPVWRNMDTPPRHIIWVLLGIIGYIGIAYARNPGNDILAFTHLPLAAMIKEGNFPVQDVAHPWIPFSYHYGASLFASATAFLTTINIALAYALQSIFCTAAIILFAAALSKEYVKSWSGSILCGVLAIAGAGLFWLQGGWLIKELFEFHILNMPSGNASIFRWVSTAITNGYAQPLLMVLHHKPISMGAAFLFATLYCLYEASTAKTMRCNWIATAVVLCAGIALTTETSFVLLLASMASYSIALLLIRSASVQQTILPYLCIAILAVLIALFQGGILSTLSHDSDASHFVFAFDGRIHYDNSIAKHTIALWEWRFIRDFGLHIIFSIFALLSFWKRKQMFLLFIGIVAYAHMFAPLFVRFTPRLHEMNRLFYPWFGLSSLLIGIYLWNQWLTKSEGPRRVIGIIIVAMMLLASTLNTSVRLIFPELELEKTSLFPKLPAISKDEQELYAWVQNHTSVKDYFYLHDSFTDIPLLKERQRFSAHTGRHAIGQYFEQLSADYENAFLAIEQQCSAAAFAKAKLKYFVILTEERADWFATHCKSSEWEKLFPENEHTYPGIYKIL